MELTPYRKANMPMPRAFLILVSLIAGSIAFRSGLDSLFGKYPAPFFFLFSVIATGLYGGIRWGLAATAITALINFYFFMPPLHSFSLTASADKTFILGIYLALGIIFSLVSEFLLNARRQAEQKLAQAERAEAAHRESESRFMAFMNNNLALAWMKDAEGRYVFVNEPFARVFERPAEWWIGQTDFDCWPQAIAERLWENDQTVLASQKAMELNEKVPLPDGRMRDWVLIKFPVTSAAGRRMTGGMAIDITEQKVDEENLRMKNVELQALTQATTAFIQSGNPGEASRYLLDGALALTQSEMGFVGVMTEGALRVLAYQGIDWEAEGRREFKAMASGAIEAKGYFEFKHFDNLFGKVLTTGEAVIANRPAAHPASSGKLPAGHPALHSFLGVPMRQGNTTAGIIAVANRIDGYGEEQQQRLEVMAQTSLVLNESFRQHMENLKAQAELALSAKVLAASGEGIVITDADNNIVSVNPSVTAITGYTADELIGQSPGIFKSGRHDTAFYQEMWRSIRTAGRWEGEVWDRRKSGEIYPKWLAIDVIRDDKGAISNHIAIFSDITERMAARERIEYQAHYDALTSLPNRVLFHERLDYALAAARRRRKQIALLFIDLDNFKYVNDTHGHSVGDELLTTVARRLKDCIREVDTVARLGGDEFVVIFTEMEDDHEIVDLAQRIISSLSAPYHLKDHMLITTPSIGIGIFPHDGQDSESLIKNADAAMYSAKEKGRNNYQFFTSKLNVLVKARLEGEQDLRAALDGGQFAVYYQPIVRAGGRQLTGMEALLRWEHPNKGLILPDQFISLAEDTGLIIPIGEWVLRMACTMAKLWLDAGHGGLRMRVNLSKRQILQADMPATVRKILQETALPASCLELELTETAIMQNIEKMAEVLQAFRDMGVAVAVDDFGSGYSSFGNLKHLPVSVLKIDRCFVNDLTSASEDRAIVRAILALAQALDLKTVAEGVETEEQAAYLHLERCDELQGFLHGHALPPEKFLEMLEDRDQADKPQAPTFAA